MRNAGIQEWRDCLRPLKKNDPKRPKRTPLDKMTSSGYIAKNIILRNTQDTIRIESPRSIAKMVQRRCEDVAVKK